MVRIGLPAVLSLLLGSCSGASVVSRPMARLEPVSEEAPVYLFVREDELPSCPWEVIGSVEADEDWLEHQARRDAVSEAVRRMGGQAVIVDARDDLQLQVIRFLDPFSICDPRD